MIDLSFVVLLVKLSIFVLPGILGLYWLHHFRADPMMTWYDLCLKYPALARRMSFNFFRGSLYALCSFLILASPIGLWNGILEPMLENFEKRPVEFLPIVSREPIEEEVVDRQFDGMTADDILAERTRTLPVER